MKVWQDMPTIRFRDVVTDGLCKIYDGLRSSPRILLICTYANRFRRIDRKRS